MANGKELLSEVMPEMFKMNVDFSNGKTATAIKGVKIIEDNEVRTAQDIIDKSVLPSDEYLIANSKYNTNKE